jgi:spore coat protein H
MKGVRHLSCFAGEFLTVFLRRNQEHARASAIIRGVFLVLLISFDQTRAHSQSALDLFSSTNLIQINISVPKAGMAALRAYHWDRDNPNPTNRPYALAQVSADGRFFTNVAVHLKGSFGSFRPVNDLPALTLNLDKFAPGQEFHGLNKFSLNNSLQDPTCLHEKLCRELFDAAGVPVPQATHAVVTLNGRRLGLYVLTEGFGKHFLKRYFKKANGDLYDAGYLQDIDHPQELRLDFGNQPDGLPALRRLLAATRQPGPVRRFRELEQVLDVDRFLSMMAMEVILCHWDSYSMNRNNYRIYYDPGSGKLVFMPHGMDQVLGIDRRNLDLPLLPPMAGRVSHALVSTPEGRQRYLARIELLFTRLFKPEELCRHLRQIDAKIAPELRQPQPRWPVRGRDPRAFIMSSGDHAQDVDELCLRISTRADNLRKQLARLSARSEPPLEK